RRRRALPNAMNCTPRWEELSNVEWYIYVASSSPCRRYTKPSGWNSRQFDAVSTIMRSRSVVPDGSPAMISAIALEAHSRCSGVAVSSNAAITFREAPWSHTWKYRSDDGTSPSNALQAQRFRDSELAVTVPPHDQVQRRHASVSAPRRAESSRAMVPAAPGRALYVSPPAATPS